MALAAQLYSRTHSTPSPLAAAHQLIPPTSPRAHVDEVLSSCGQALGEMETRRNFLQSRSGRRRRGSSASFLCTFRPVVLEQHNQLVEQPVSLCQHHHCPLPLSKVPATHPSHLPHRDLVCEQPWPREVSEVSQ